MFPPFNDCSQDDIDRLVGEFPLAWVVTRDFNATLLPLLAERGEDGRIASFLGHCGRRNHIVGDLRADPAALILFQGPSGYISNRIVSEPDWGPTWNYAAVRFLVDIEWVEEETPAAVDRLLDHMDGPEDQRWTPKELGARYHGMVERIIAFRAHVREVRPTFKLGQDESPPIFAEIVSRHGDRQLAAWMEALARE
ncbi:MAG: FMN-binding negative transcriptional regulator [Novosphingobium sp.]|nr:FMN-binding negative transcriptional regulator [Novosphingobium sp.]